MPVAAAILDTLVPRGAVRADLEMEIVVAGQPDLGAAGIIILQQERERLGRALLAELVAQIAVAAFGHGLGDEQCVVELGAQAIGRVRRGADAEQSQILDRRHGRKEIAPGRAVPHQQRALVGHEREPAGLRRAELPGAVLPGGDRVDVAGPGAGRAGLDDPALALRRRAGRRA